MAEAAGFVEFTLIAVTPIIAVVSPASTTAVYTALAEEMTWSEHREIIISGIAEAMPRLLANVEIGWGT